MTSTIAWSTVWSVYPTVDADEGPGWGPGLMTAWQPWAGHYAVPPTVWATAHTTQFAAPGWRMLAVGSGASELLPGKGGSHVAFVSADGADVSVVVETSGASAVQTLAIALKGGLAARVRTLHVWRSNATASFAARTSAAAVAAPSAMTSSLSSSMA